MPHTQLLYRPPDRTACPPTTTTWIQVVGSKRAKQRVDLAAGKAAQVIRQDHVQERRTTVGGPPTKMTFFIPFLCSGQDLEKPEYHLSLEAVWVFRRANEAVRRQQGWDVTASNLKDT